MKLMFKSESWKIAKKIYLCWLSQLLINAVVYILAGNITTESKLIENPKWQEADQLAIYKRNQGIEPGTSCNKLNR